MTVADGFLARRVLRHDGEREIHFGEALACSGDHGILFRANDRLLSIAVRATPGATLYRFSTTNALHQTHHRLALPMTSRKVASRCLHISSVSPKIPQVTNGDSFRIRDNDASISWTMRFLLSFR